MTDKFEREERYIVIKRKHLDYHNEIGLREVLKCWEIPTVGCVVVESDWPEYETVWRMIEARVTGQQAKYLHRAYVRALDAIKTAAQKYGQTHSSQSIPTGDLYRSIAASQTEAAYAHLAAVIAKEIGEVLHAAGK